MVVLRFAGARVCGRCSSCCWCRRALVPAPQGERVIREIGVRMNIELPQFKLTRREVLISTACFHDPRVQAAVRAREPGERASARRGGGARGQLRA